MEQDLAYVVRVTRSKTGEHIPLVWDQDAGFPAWWPNAWLLTDLRPTGIAFGTLQNQAYVIAGVMTWARSRGLDLVQRWFSHDWLTPTEQANLADYLRTVRADRDVVPVPRRKAPGALKAEPETVGVVDSNTASTRLHVAAKFLQWLGDEAVSRMPKADRAPEVEALAQMVVDLRAKLKGKKGRNNLGGRMAPPLAEIARLFEVLEPDHPENPWTKGVTLPRKQGQTKRAVAASRLLALRNRLIVHALYHLGIRRGELLGIKGKDVDQGVGLVSIVRRPDDPEDPRKYPPNVKTRERDIPCNGGLLAQLVGYVSQSRSALPHARKHPFVVVAHDDGAPLALISVNKILEELREVPGVSKNLSPHILRHAWNDMFSRLCDEQKVHKDLEAQLRSYLMGWSPVSKTAATYDVRHIRQVATELSLLMQVQVMNPPKPNAEGAKP
jgi:integrase